MNADFECATPGVDCSPQNAPLSPHGEHLVSVSRYLAARAPTARAIHQPYWTAMLLFRGNYLTVAADEADA